MPQENEKRGDLPHNPSNRTVMEEEEDSAVLLAASIFGLSYLDLDYYKLMVVLSGYMSATRMPTAHRG